jgi:hypothetical protein
LSGSDFCEVVGACVTEGAGPHGNNEDCTIQANVDLVASAIEFVTEAGFDWVSIGGVQYSGTSGPSQVLMSAGDTMVWRSDWSVVNEGSTI